MYRQCRDELIKIKEKVKDKNYCGCPNPCFNREFDWTTSYSAFPGHKMNSEAFKENFPQIYDSIVLAMPHSNFVDEETEENNIRIKRVYYNNLLCLNIY